jgi:hypothetical protein
MSIDTFEWWNQIQGFSEELDKPEIEKEDGSNYKVNSYNYRCDEFTTNHKGKHVLFSGCSNTYGLGLKKEEVWAHKVYNKINEKENSSGYFNIGLSGNNIINSILNIFKYCKKFGNPDTIFINLPCHSRFFDFEKNNMIYKIKSYDDFYDNYYINKLTIYNYYFMLEQYCKTNNIELFSFTWNLYDKYYLKSLYDKYYFNKNKKIFIKSTNDIFKEYNFETFYYIKEDILNNTLFLLKQKHDNFFFDIARDNKHRGDGIHLYWSNFIYNKYLEKKIK